jgi:hypothetical protein
VNLGMHKDSRLRRGWTRRIGAAGFAVVVGVFGLVGVHPAEGRVDAAPAVAGPARREPVEPFADLPVPPALVDVTTSTTVPPPETTTTTTAPPETTTTTTVPPPPAPPAPSTSGPLQPKPPAAPRAIPSTGPQAQAAVEAIADSSGWNWRAAGVRFNLSFYPSDCCHWGVYEAAKSVIWVGPTAFADANRLRYVVLHELAHAWQYRQNRFAQFIADYSVWGFTTIGPALEAAADCLANVWGAVGGHYWSCPANARALAARRVHGDWG